LQAKFGVHKQNKPFAVEKIKGAVFLKDLNILTNQHRINPFAVTSAREQ